VVGIASGSAGAAASASASTAPKASASASPVVPATGTVTGTVTGQLEMKYVDNSATLAKGAIVTTAGESLPNTCDTSPYPPGLLIGTITSVSNDPNLVVQGATIQPAAHLTDATFLLVITNYTGGFGPPAASGSPGIGGCVPAGSAAPSASPTATPKPTATPRRTATPKPAPTPKPTATPTY
jgi:hypothetical protein